ncbi:hypothetical protein GCM10017673_37000 [Streptosporangium violaceochromogenes]|nr:hypothetical protein GCM10017673_37000 [Streptosporangium violaceochromogenes]
MTVNRGLTVTLGIVLACGLLAASRSSARKDAWRPRADPWKARAGSAAAFRPGPGARLGPVSPLRFELTSEENSSQAVYDGGRVYGRFTVGVNVRNLNDRPVTIFGIGRSGPGLRLVSSRLRAPRTLQPGQTRGFDLEYEIAGCKAVPRGDWPIPLRVGRGGRRTAYASLWMTAPAGGAAGGGTDPTANGGTGGGTDVGTGGAAGGGTGGAAGGTRSWQSVLATEVCGP